MNGADNREELIFEAALKLPADQRPAYLDSACVRQPELRHRVEGLLGAFARAGAFLNEPQISPAMIAPQKPGDTIGRYKLLEQIGEGGCGVVYVAEQEQPVRRRVALKVVKLGMDTRQVIARFDAERQALAMMDHPNIAKVLDAGATETGRPYFVMELVRGIRITDYCDQNHLPPRERLNLFIQVCRAIQHAHQKGIIHRDIKPSNILVTLHDGVPGPKVIDFGIAKATQGRLTDQTVYTAFQQFIGTPAYMSPEQAEMSGLDIDTRTDIYSLGVLLYELLTGETPFDAEKLMAAGLDEMRRTIREVEPVKPSTRLTQQTVTAKLRTRIDQSDEKIRASSRRLLQDVRGDLDWIVMKCLEKDRTQRYQTANGLSADIGRHLNNEPVVACPPSKLYRLQKTIGRNKVVFTAAATVLAALVSGLGISTWMFLKEKQARVRAVVAEGYAGQARTNEFILRQKAQAEEKKAHVAAEKSQQTTLFLQDMLKSVGPSVALGRDTTMLRGILDATASRVAEDLKEQPDVEAEIFYILGEVYRPLGENEKAEQMHRRALEIQVKLWGREHLAVSRSLHGLAATLLALGQLAGAEEVCAEALHTRRKLLGEEHLEVADSLNIMGLICQDRGRGPEAETLLRQALVMKRKLLPAQHPSIVTSLRDLSRVLQLRGKSAEAEPLLREALAIQKTLWGDDDLRAASLLGNLAATLSDQGNLLEAEAAQRESLVRNRKLFGKQHPQVARALGALADILRRRGKLDEIEILFREEITHAQERFPGYAEHRSDGIYSLLDVLLHHHEFSKAEQLIIEALTPALQAQPGNIGLRFNRAQFFARRGRWEEAAADFSQIKEKYPGELAMSLIQCGQFAACQQHCREILARVGDTRDPLLAQRTANFALLLPSTGDQLQAAVKLADMAVTYGPNHSFVPYFQLVKGLAEYRSGNFIAAEEWLQKSLGHGWPDGNLIAPAHLILAMTLQQLKRPDEARARLAQAYNIILDNWPYWSDGDLRSRWTDVVTARILFREAKKLIPFREDITVEDVSMLSRRSVQAPQDSILAMKVSALQAWFGQDADYEATCKRVIEAAEPASKTEDVRERAAKNWCLRPSKDSSMLPRVLALAREAARAELNVDQRPWYQQALGMAEFRAGNDAAAEAAFLWAEQASKTGNWHPKLRSFILVPCRFYRAMILFRQGKQAAANALFQEALAEMPTIPENAQRALPIQVNQDHLLCWLAHREASALLKTAPSTKR